MPIQTTRTARTAVASTRHNRTIESIITQSAQNRRMLFEENRRIWSAENKRIARQNLCENRIVFWGQDTNTCWFNAILVSAIYSQRLRRKLFKASKTWNINRSFYKLLDHVLHTKYVKSSDPYKDAVFFEKYNIVNILKMIEKLNHANYTFKFERFQHGYIHYLYIKQFYNILGLNSLMLDIYESKNEYNPNATDTPEQYVTYSLFNHIMDSKKINDYVGVSINLQSQESVLAEFNKTPDILMINVIGKTLQEIGVVLYGKYNDIKTTNPPTYYNLPDKNSSEILSLKNEIIYNNQPYVLDSIIISNWNKRTQSGHAIAALTCKGERYIYNGWKYEYISDENGNNVEVPCGLMKHNWEERSCFNLDEHTCKIAPGNASSQCFNAYAGNRIFIYVRASTKVNNKSVHSASYKSFNTMQSAKSHQPYNTAVSAKIASLGKRQKSSSYSSKESLGKRLKHRSSSQKSCNSDDDLDIICET